MKSRFESHGGTYTEIDGIFYPNIAPPDPDPRPIGIWGMRHEEYLKEHRYFTYMNLLTTGKLDSYLADIDEQARDMLEQLIEQMAKAEGVTEQMKAENQMAWVRRMISIRYRAEETVMLELICT
ncbi:MAG: TnpV protein [Oscillospiraceae bacterium]|nr:TnpV protein [Oscillospiraceae bacterium]